MREIDEIVKINSLSEIMFLRNEHKELVLKYVEKSVFIGYPFVVVFLKVGIPLTKKKYTIARAYKTIWDHKRSEHVEVKINWQKKNNFGPGAAETKIEIKDYVKRAIK